MQLLNNTYFCYDGELPTNNDKKKHKNSKQAYTDGLKSIGKKVSFAAIFIELVLKEIQKRGDKIWVIYTNYQSYMQSIEYIKENPLILNQIKRNEEADKAAKQAFDMPGMNKTKLP